MTTAREMLSITMSDAKVQDSSTALLDGERRSLVPIPNYTSSAQDLSSTALE